MSENVTTKKKSQQAILNYISVNFQKMDMNNQNGKNSPETEASASKTPKEQRPKSTPSSMTQGGARKGNIVAPQNRQVPASAGSVTILSNTPNMFLNPKSKNTPPNNTETRSNKVRTPPSIEAKMNLQKKLMMEDITSRNREANTTNNVLTNPVGNTIRGNIDTTRHYTYRATTRYNQESTNLIERVECETIPRGNIDESAPINPESTELIVIENPMEVNGFETNETLDDLGPELSKMGRILAKVITKLLSNALIPLQNDIVQLRADTACLKQSENKVEELTLENENLHARVSKLELNNQLLKKKLGKLEDHLLDNNLLFSGIWEENGETEMSRYQAILDIISTTFMGPDYQTQLNLAKKVCIEKLERKGRYMPNRIWPISVTFTHHSDILDILTNKKYLPDDIYVNQEYGEEIERERHFLQPILWAATKKTEYKRRCRLEDDHLIIKGKTFTRQNINDLPDDISAFKVTNRKDDRTIGFFGELNPLSNFHWCVFKINEKWFHSSEQYIQMKKALYFDDRETENRIIASDDALECKRLSREIKAFDTEKWNAAAETETYYGIN